MIDLDISNKNTIIFDGEKFALLNTNKLDDIGMLVDYRTRNIIIIVRNGLSSDSENKRNHITSSDYNSEPWGYWKYYKNSNCIVIYPDIRKLPSPCWLSNYYPSEEFDYREPKYVEAVDQLYSIYKTPKFKLFGVTPNDIPKWLYYVSNDKPYIFPKLVPKCVVIIHSYLSSTMFFQNEKLYLKVRKELESIGYVF